MKQERVTVIYGSQPQKMVQELVEKTGLLDRLRPGDSVVIKPNLVVSRREWAGVNTNPRVVEAVVLMLKERGISRITIGDGSGMGYNATKTFDLCGYRRLAKQYECQLVDLERDRFVTKEVPVEGPFEKLQIAETVLQCDFLINVPVMKAHMETLVTCSLKNLKGVMPRAMKTAFHGAGLERAISQLASVVSPDMILVDGLQGDLSSETGRTPVAMETMILGENPVEVDSVVADMLGYTPRMIRHIGYSSDAGLGSCDLKEIKVRPLNRPSKERVFKPAPHFTERFPAQIHAAGACCTCMGNLVFALERLRERGLLSRDQCFLVGQKASPMPIKRGFSIAVGKCAAKLADADLSIDECPPSANGISRRVGEMIQTSRKRAASH